MDRSLFSEGVHVLTIHRQIEVTVLENVVVVRFLNRKIIDAANIQELGEELFSLVESEKHTALILTFRSVEFLSSAALNKLIMLDKKLKECKGKLRLCEMRSDIREVFDKYLSGLFVIRENVQIALCDFASAVSP